MDRKQHIAIFTTASLPWMTGTAVNPLFRAAYLSKDGERNITLVIPWLSSNDQGLVYPSNIMFRSPSEQEMYVRQWLEERTGFKSAFGIRFYPGKFSRDKRSILPVGDIAELISDEEADVAVLEEPEHLTWYHHGKRWKTKFRLVIGVIHTNYLEYVKREKNGRIQAFLLKQANGWVVNIYCHKVIRLSAATQDYPNSIICNVHGVNPKFLEIGQKKMQQQQNEGKAFSKGAYYIGKMVWSKGYKELLKLLGDHQKELTGFEIDLYGNGEDSDQVRKAAEKLELAIRVNPGRDHADPLFHDYKVFLNPSTTDVVCTTTAEALAMGKWVVCANHPSNDFFKQFPNCRTYDDSKGFVDATQKALSEEPAQMTDDLRYELSWEAATERFLKAAQLDQASATKLSRTTSNNFMSTSLNFKRKMEDASAYLHYVASGYEMSRRAFGAIPGSLQPDEELRKDLGLPPPPGKRGSRS
ncbi:digalactosyldiacylglycerol synthase 2, chloroplastic isoform X1 [Syzygium oleosum]|uniref:digalactosyldiacylglycerol synthase 2, chloroplastic isoform X1 n=1 Tax=Syzygium oleosum TaxID=219896 RepID=UPI0011D27C60|nr:digalactosyldiacylglycerol synthase 2, chloroplastic isoform X1 [Syzygium oleosum]XP_056160530.1 digalactosyldiacylglycerol synthase 2, chloroplastic isoform X1 [Syzygium oleosum]XP_056160531.1 digalactosyldiacylglycerol synthase 2, chloroplastic isoform X1 [Syzygium oleosum]XP_056160532.1 digalactosyldiacylglycerol synthase 2, chloroplastic isoform X1 [Syzygium oleosum]